MNNFLVHFFQSYLLTREMKTTKKLFAGIEGGGTKTILNLVDLSGSLVASQIAGPSNPWSLSSKNEDGFVLAARLFADLIEKGIKSLEENEKNEGDKTEYCLEAVGICLSGGGTEQANKRLMKELNERIKCKIFIGNDTLAPVFTAFKDGGIVVISGTGSNCVLINPIDETIPLETFDQLKCFSSGGWGNLLGDEGSSYWIAQKAIKYLIDFMDNFLSENDDQGLNHDINTEIEELKEVIFQHFQVTNLSEILPYFYSDFKKDFIAGLTFKLSKIAEKRSIVRFLFEEAGYELARHIIAILPKIDQRLLNSADGLPIVCAGSVFKSWHLIKPGFLRCFQDKSKNCINLNALNLVKIDGDSAIGAAYLAARIHEPNSDFVKNFDNKKFISQLDTLYVKQLLNLKNQLASNRPHQIKFPICKDEQQIAYKEV